MYLQRDHQSSGRAVGVSDYEASPRPALHTLLVRDDIQVRRVDVRDQYGHSCTHHGRAEGSTKSACGQLMSGSSAVLVWSAAASVSVSVSASG